MYANYHTHTARCHHATGTDEEYIQKAIAENIKVLGFSDHAPYLYPNGYVSYYKMLPCEAEEYMSSLRALREKYRDKIEILIGYEAEYYPELWEETFAFWKKCPPEYLILGQHFFSEEYVPKEALLKAPKPMDNPDLFKKYVDTAIAAMETGVFTYIAHPDIPNFTGDDDLYRSEMERLVLAAKANNLPLEINLHGMLTGHNYPCRKFWEIAAKHKPDVIIGCDAHNPSEVGNADNIARALRLIDGLDLNLIDRVKPINPFE